MNNEEIGKYCRYFRQTILNKTLKEVAGDTNIKTLSAFEHGRSTNMNHLFKYVDSIDNDDIKIYFLVNVIEILKGENENAREV